MVKGYHAIWSCYGFWLPNDARGSWSNEVWAKHLRPFGEATKTNSRRSLADAPHDVQQNPTKVGLRAQTWSFVTAFES
jgi:hypothetical protein